ncbi:unnamed protein product [Cyprideis torosa]|uniref:Uncharacterized protein n=1 Tax=Cyprideis torosa TaxID=163714 RepID=A0A7R8ZRG6_9CRUS|nr:unnamed protein product [Cyprideis torosa]CAG0898879.1 unnamed protein product [Cyprideis torosa]
MSGADAVEKPVEDGEQKEKDNEEVEEAEEGGTNGEAGGAVGVERGAAKNKKRKNKKPADRTERAAKNAFQNAQTSLKENVGKEGAAVKEGEMKKKRSESVADNEEEAKEDEREDREGKKKNNRPKGGGGGNCERATMAQTDPPSIPITLLFPDGNYPTEQIVLVGYKDLRRSAEVDRETREYMYKLIKPGMTMIEICETLEKTARTLIQEDGLKTGLDFPADGTTSPPE